MTGEAEVSARFPRVREHVRGLPHGLDSHPACQVKSSLVRAIVESSQSDVAEALRATLELARNSHRVEVDVVETADTWFRMQASWATST